MSKKTFIEELYEPKDPYLEEKTFVHNLFFHGAVEHAVRMNKESRHFEGYFKFGEEGGSLIHPTAYFTFDDDYWVLDRVRRAKDWNWKYIEKLLNDEVKDIGFKNYEIKVLESFRPEKVRDGYTFFFG